MKKSALFLAAALMAASAAFGQDVPPPPAGETPNQPPPTPDQELPEVLNRGPVHEAFAEPVNLQAQAGLVVPQPPPADIEEIPPNEKPQGNQYVWVPGYWSWDGDRHDFVWVSACWRIAPPDMVWVPGYWNPVTSGWEWVPGYWAPANVQDVQYLPSPPAVADLQPPVQPPSPESVWVPPCWYWNQDQYVLRSGYWLTADAGWLWVPSHYVRRGRGYVFCGGHWDYPLERRGVLFAPVRFPRSYYGRAGFVYSPSIVLDVSLLTSCLFAYPLYGHYYFGDYYDDAYLTAGIYPWFDCDRIHTWYDPIYQHNRWRHRRTDPRWEERERHNYDLYRADQHLRPSRTYREALVQLASLPEPERKNRSIAQSLSDAVRNRTTAMKFEPINAGIQRDIARQAGAEIKSRDERNREGPPPGTTIGAPAGERRPPGMPAVERRPPSTTITESKTPFAIPPTRTEGVKSPFTSEPPKEHRDVVLPPVERRTPTLPPESKTPATMWPSERKEPAAPPVNVKSPEIRSQESAPRVIAPVERPPPFVAPREVRSAPPERVAPPAPPIVSKPAAAAVSEKGPPPQATDDDKRSTDDVKSGDSEKGGRDRNSGGKPR